MAKEAKNSNNKGLWLLIAGIILICIAVVCIVLFLIKGQTTVTSSTDSTTTEHLSCESHTTPYPLFEYDESDSKSLKVNATFENDSLSSISLIYKLTYQDEDKLKLSEAKNHYALNHISQGEGLGPDAYNAKYSKGQDSIQLSLYANKSEIESKTLKYFMLNKLTSTPYTQNQIIKAYAAQGLKCEKQ